MQLTLDQKDALQELLNIGVGRAAGSLNQMLEKPIKLHIPHIEFGQLLELQHQIDQTGNDMLSSVQLPFQGSFVGSVALMFPTESTPKLVSALTGEEDASNEFDSLKEATLTEIGNIVLNGVMGSLGNILTQPLIYSVPMYYENTIKGLLGDSAKESSAYFLWAQTHFTVEEFDLSGDILLMFQVGDLEKFLENYDRPQRKVDLSLSTDNIDPHC